jgi:Skp family chaperone for outer membrane proteins
VTDEHNDADGGNDGGNDDAGGGEPEFYKSQRQFDDAVKVRLERQKAQYQQQLKGAEEVKKRLQEIEDADKSELQKAQDRAAELERRATEAEKAQRETLYEAAVIAEAASKHVADPRDVARLLNRADIVFGDDGSPTNISDVVDSLLKAKPYLVTGGAGPVDQGARGGGVQADQLTRDDLKNMKPDEIVKARQEGRLDTLMQGQ